MSADDLRDPRELDAPGAGLAPSDGTTPAAPAASAGEPGVDPEASGGVPDREGARRTEMTEMGVPGATGGGPQKLVPEAEAEDRLAEALDAQPGAQGDDPSDPGLGETGAGSPAS